MEKVKKNFGFGCMRLPMKDGEVDTAEMNRMVDAFMDAGFNYFDTAHVYLQGKSETALRTCLTSRYPRESYVLTDKLTANLFKCEADIRPVFESQLAACGVEYFDFYLMHAQGTENYSHFQKCRAYETAFALKAEGKVRHVGISFHDRTEVLEQILADHPDIEAVQIQFNYQDYNDSAIQSRRCYEVCVAHNKPVIVMEPVKGGNLMRLPEDARAVLDALHGGSPASYAIRFAAGFPGMMMVLSGMSDLDGAVQPADNEIPRRERACDIRPDNTGQHLCPVLRVQRRTGGAAHHLHELRRGQGRAHKGNAAPGAADDGVFRRVLDGAEHGVPERLHPHFHGAHAGDTGYGARHHQNLCAVVLAASVQHFLDLLFSGDNEAAGGVHRVGVARPCYKRHYHHAPPGRHRRGFAVVCHAGDGACCHALCRVGHGQVYKGAA